MGISKKLGCRWERNAHSLKAVQKVLIPDEINVFAELKLSVDVATRVAHSVATNTSYAIQLVLELQLVLGLEPGHLLVDVVLAAFRGGHLACPDVYRCIR